MNLMKNHTSIPIPQYKIGWLIGKNGYSINYIRNKTDTDIIIADDVLTKFGGDWKKITIHGSWRGINNALMLIYMRLDEYIHIPKAFINTDLNNAESCVNQFDHVEMFDNYCHQKMFDNYYQKNNQTMAQQYLNRQNQPYIN
tara:strand:- start:73 stop:498 length:426 start_codon:yes stop_codon:yes gene_type:complete